MKADIPDFLPTLPRLAELFGRPTAWIQDLKSRDERFPEKTARGWPVLAVGALIMARELERMTDADFDAENHARARATLTHIEAGGDPWNTFPAAALSRLQSALRETAAGRHDRTPDGHTARETAIADCLDALKRNG